MVPPLFAPPPPQVDTIVKYSLYIFAGLTGVLGCLLTRRAAARGGSFGVPQLMLLVSALSVLTCLGLGGYLIYKAQEYGSPWWSYLLNGVVGGGRGRGAARRGGQCAPRCHARPAGTADCLLPPVCCPRRAPLLPLQMIVQRILYLVMLCFLFQTIGEASTQEAVRDQMLHHQRAVRAEQAGMV